METDLVLEEAAIEICSEILKGETVIIDGYEYVVLSDAEECFKAGAKWQAGQFEKNRLKHCNSITNEQAELEQGFIDQHLDKYQRMPTFLDAIEFGRRLQKEQMMKKGVETTFNVSLPSGLYDKLWIKGCKEGDKLLVIKKDEL